MAVEEKARAATRRAIRPTTVEVAPEEQVAHEIVPVLEETVQEAAPTVNPLQVLPFV